MDKIIKNDSGNLKIQASSEMGCGIVEVLHLFDKKHNSGCVIAYFGKRTCDGSDIAECCFVHSRPFEIEYDEPSILFDALEYGQKLADLIIESKEEK